ncbi:MAG: hypothetical protein D3923_15410, partial [Candidatus Electrothrix sp. AR3]|nr:hypothetical protein [Candidatus Electrothrix sp. AR3]
MRTTLDCLVCFLHQARTLGSLATNDPVTQRQLLDYAGQYISSVDTKRSPPENVTDLYAGFAHILQLTDPFAQVKLESNTFALSLKEEIRQCIIAAEEPLRAAV